MVNIRKEDDKFHFEIQGMHKLWAFKSTVEVPVSHVKKAYKCGPDDIGFINGFRFPGTHVPGLITAGTYYRKDGKVFCDVVNKEKAIVVELDHESYEKLIVEVENPDESIAILTEA